MSPVIRIWCQTLYRLDIAAQFVRYDDTRLTELFDQPEGWSHRRRGQVPAR